MYAVHRKLVWRGEVSRNSCTATFNEGSLSRGLRVCERFLGSYACTSGISLNSDDVIKVVASCLGRCRADCT